MCDDDLEAQWSQFRVFRETQLPSVPTKLAAKDPMFYCKCGGIKVFGEDNIPVCTSCGVCDKEYIEEGPEWSSNVDETGQVNDGARCGAPKDTELFSEQWGASTIIDTRGASYAAKKIARLNFHMSMNHRDRALYHAYKGMEEIAKNKLKLQDNVIRQAKIMYRKFNTEKLTRGAVRTGIKANCILAACKINGCSRTTKEVAEAFEIPTKDISRTSQLFRETILGEEPKKSAITKPINVIPRIMNKFSCENKRRLSAKANKLCEHLEECVQLMGKNPTSVACVVVMKVLELTKQQVYEVCSNDTSIPTLTKIENIVNKYLEDKPF